MEQLITLLHWNIQQNIETEQLQRLQVDKKPHKLETKISCQNVLTCVEIQPFHATICLMLSSLATISESRRMGRDASVHVIICRTSVIMSRAVIETTDCPLFVLCIQDVTD